MEFITLKPEFKSQDTAYYIEKGNVHKTIIKYAILHLYNIPNASGEVIDSLCFYGQYVQDICTFKYANPWITDEKYLYKNEESARTAAKWYKIDRSYEDWSEAIGRRNLNEKSTDMIQSNKFDIESSDLGICCAEISEIRSTLYKLEKEGGIMEIDRIDLHERVKNHGLELEQKTKLYEILKEIEVI